MYEFLALHVRDAMTADVVTLGQDSTVADAERIFERHNFNGLPIVDRNGQLQGMLTKLDLLKAFAFTPQSIAPHYEEVHGRSVGRYMTTEALSVSPDAPLTRVLEALVATRYKSLPVVTDGRLIGIIAREDVLRAIRRVAGRGEMEAREL
jgi:CBS domain-containing protein